MFNINDHQPDGATFYLFFFKRKKNITDPWELKNKLCIID